MKKQKVYLDTSVIGGYYDKEFKEHSEKLFELFIKGEYIAVISTTTITELEKAPEKVRNLLLTIPEENIVKIEITQEMIDLADMYLEESIVTTKYSDDALHIATASVSGMDVLVSWNFKHIVNLNKIKQFNAVNLREGYAILEIRTPREVLLNNEENI